MKNQILVILIAISQCCLAQNLDFRNNVSFSSGRSLFSSLRGTNATPSGDLKFTDGKVKATPTFQLAYDFQVNNWFSIGVAGTYNQATISFTDVKYLNKVIGTANAKVSRTGLSIRPLFHYGKGKLDLYSGGRLGVGFWYGKIGTNVDDALFSDLLSSIGVDTPGFITSRLSATNLRGGFPLPQVQLIPIGAKYYFTDNFGAHLETGLFGAYYVTIGADMRF
jgi:hypothetical protein